MRLTLLMKYLEFLLRENMLSRLKIKRNLLVGQMNKYLISNLDICVNEY